MNLSEHVSHVPHGSTMRVQCPSCSHNRRKSQLKDLVITREDGGLLYSCKHCGEEGIYRIENRIKPMEKKLSAVPNPSITKEPLSDAHYAFLLNRGISKMTADAMQLFGANKFFPRLSATADCIGFPYYRGGAFTSAKYRTVDGKNFVQDNGGAHDFFGIDQIDATLPIIIVEGEIDCLTLIEVGITNAVSVPSGAPLKVADGKVSAEEDKRFSFVWNAFDKLTQSPSIILATDNDQSGHALAEELARRIGKDKCKLCKIGMKDVNEVLLAEGADAVRKIINDAEPYPVSGLNSAKDFKERLNDLWEKGTGTGNSTGYSSIDQIYTVVAGQLTVVTGYPSSGKSNFVDQLMVNLGRNDDWKFALCSFENAPEVHISRLIEIYNEKRFIDGTERMDEDEFKKGLDWVDDHFVFLTSESSEPATIESILERAKIAVARMGIRGMVIDPYNYIEMNKGSSETEAISNMLTRVQQFAKNSGVHVWFVAHPSKITRSGTELPRPDGMSISGSMAWWAKADCGLTVHRVEKDTQIAVWKCRYRWVGTLGEVTLKYNKTTGTYEENDDLFF